ncbi:ankyrin repeat protein, putative [Trichomonas vaginalis G3]|uniref:Ankyrin repeat protein, putative n=1 Tax=Trichomonas vaginalis (strain ATCC PRA-98 / G3) TaxID=412133 RepID=A2F1V7_TRIV3|nr:ankyrin repeat and SOCS box-containing protein 4 family [Trichomonas vaginalis G3]EAY01102.1 ankyrin repeat protein, putative [Trichomonas vaginalis G3]KAI5517419.1 ankyrin repeat and SOCS box-containing protein 4 family [Trichomonas vaginalis G3]|eukprot:XP_001313954.1 ankyrin repeat protein [Trichomonas vaginalis G3]
MSEQDVNSTKYSEVRSIFKYDIDIYNALYQLKTENEDDLNSIYKLIKTELIDSKKYPPVKVMKDILDIIKYNNRYTKSYLTLAKLISDDYHVTEVNNLEHISNLLFYKEYGIKLDKFRDFGEFNLKNLSIHTENTIYKAIMNNDIKAFIQFTEREGFNKDQRVLSHLYPLERKIYPFYYITGFSLLELCCYHGAVDCFKLLRTKLQSEITQICLKFSFLGRNQEIMSECLKYQKPDYECMEYAIISHNIDFVTFLMNEHQLEINLDYCIKYNNLESFLVYFDQTNDIYHCFIKSVIFNIPTICEYFLSNGASINAKNIAGETALHIAAKNNSKETVEFLISHGINIDEKDYDDGKAALHHAAGKNHKETAEVLISHGININEKDEYGQTALHHAAKNNHKLTAELLISHGININDKNIYGKTALHGAVHNNSEEMAQLLISHGININDKNIYGKTALHGAVHNNSEEMAQLLISHGININEKDKNGETALHYAAENNNKEIAEFLISHGININEKNNVGETALHYATNYNSKKAAEVLISHGIHINEKDEYGQTALHIAANNDSEEIAKLLISHGANINDKDQDGRTALHIAANNDSEEIAKLLISHGALKLNVKNIF